MSTKSELNRTFILFLMCLSILLYMVFVNDEVATQRHKADIVNIKQEACQFEHFMVYYGIVIYKCKYIYPYVYINILSIRIIFFIKTKSLQKTESGENSNYIYYRKTVF